MAENCDLRTTLTVVSNSLVNGGDFCRLCRNVKFCRNMASQIADKFGSNATLVFSSQDYDPCVCRTRRCCYDNIIEIYDIESGTTSDDISAIYSAFILDVVWVTDDQAVIIFESDVEANIALALETISLFKTRKLIDGSDEAIITTIKLAYPEGSKEFILQQESPPSTPKRRIDVEKIRRRNLFPIILEGSKRGRGGKQQLPTYLIPFPTYTSTFPVFLHIPT